MVETDGIRWRCALRWLCRRGRCAWALFLLVAIGSPAARGAEPRPPALIPSAGIEHRSGGSVRFGAPCVLVSEEPDRDAYALSILRGALGAPSGAALAEHRRRAPTVSRIQLRAAAVSGLAPGRVASQSYAIDVSAGTVLITGPTPAARLHGAETLRQLALVEGGILPCGRIVDGPALEVRGFSLDISRGRLPDRAEFIRILDLLAAFKLNTLLIYIEDTFPFSDLPADAVRGYVLTPGVLRELSTAARSRSIELIPIIETLGHQERMLAHASMRRFSERAATLSPWQGFTIDVRDWLERRLRPRGHSSSDAESACAMFATTDPRTRRLLDSMVDDILASSGAKSIHIGCDEPAELGHGASAAACRSRGEGAVFAEHVRQLAQHARSRWGATTWIFDDFVLAHPGVAAQLPDDLVLVDWHYDPDAAYGSLDSLGAAWTRRVVTSAGLWNWYGIYPDYSRSLPNILNSTRAAVAHGCLGSMLASWGDGGAEDLFGNDVLGIAYFAACAWDPGRVEAGAFLHDYCHLRFGAAGDAMVPLYRALSEIELPSGGYNQRVVDRPVLVRRRTPAWTAAMARLQGRLGGARLALASVSPVDTYAAAELEALGCTADRFRVAADRELTLDSVAIALHPGEPAGPRPASPELVTALGRLRDAEASAQRDYLAAWLAHNEESELSSIRTRFRARLAALDSLRTRAAAGRLSVPARFR